VSDATFPGEALVRAARRFGTPVHVTFAGALASAARELEAAFPDPWLRAFSLKANDVPSVVARLGAVGLDANVVSSGEWAAARAAGLPNDRITLEGVGKSAADLRAAVHACAAGDPLRWVAVESAEELEALVAMAARAGLGVRGRTGIRGRTGLPALDVLLRLNPDVQPETHAGLAVGRGSSKFGMTETELTAAVASLALDGPVAARGVHVHVGSQLGAVDAWRDCRGSTRSMSVAGSLWATPAPCRRPPDSPRSYRACSRRSPSTGGRDGWRWSPDGSSSPAPAGSWQRCCTSASVATPGGSWCWMRG
jgi:diaminopimelate decarboxylase